MGCDLPCLQCSPLAETQTGASPHLFRGCAGSRRGRTPSKNAARSRGTPCGCSHHASAAQQVRQDRARQGRAAGGAGQGGVTECNWMPADGKWFCRNLPCGLLSSSQRRHTNRPGSHSCLPGCVSGRWGSVWCCCSATACRHQVPRAAAPPALPPTAASAHMRLAREPPPRTASRSGACRRSRLLPSQPRGQPRQLLPPLPLRPLLAPPRCLLTLTQAPWPALAVDAGWRRRRAAGSSASWQGGRPGSAAPAAAGNAAAGLPAAAVRRQRRAGAHGSRAGGKPRAADRLHQGRQEGHGGKSKPGRVEC
jgi:hypothetical protein